MLNQPLNMLTNACICIYYNNRSFACSWWTLLKMYKTKNVNLPSQPPWDIGALPGKYHHDILTKTTEHLIRQLIECNS